MYPTLLMGQPKETLYETWYKVASRETCKAVGHVLEDKDTYGKHSNSKPLAHVGYLNAGNNTGISDITQLILVIKLTLKVPTKICSRRHLNFLSFSFFSEK